MRRRGKIERFLSRLAPGAEQGVALVEFAVTLPLMVVLVVGIFDFGSAFDVKQKIANTARAGARFASSLPTNDLFLASTPDSVLAVRNMIDASLISQKINDCGLRTQTGTATGPGTMGWVFTASGGGCPGTLTVEVDRSYAPATATVGVPIHVVYSRVTISYPYKWQFGRVIGLVAPGATYANGVSQISTSAVVPNMD